jgi:hypothetical protein
MSECSPADKRAPQRGPARPVRTGGAELGVSLWWIALPLALLLVMVLFYPFRYVFEFDRDEGINAMKALLMLRGFSLYSEVWNDQPPIFTLLLTLWFRIFGLRVAAGRILVLLFSTALVGAAAYYLRRWWGVAASVTGVIFLALLPLYLELSVSIMIGLPSISLAMVSIVCQAAWHEQRRSTWLVLSSGLLALSVLTKAFTVILFPIWVIGIALAILGRSASAGRPLRSCTPLFAWVLVFGSACALALFFMVGLGNLDQLFQVHLAAESVPAFRTSDLLPGINDLLVRPLPVILLALAGAVYAYRSKKWSALYLAAWLVAAYALLLVHRPAWPHQQLLVTVPAAVLAAAAAGSAIEGLLKGRRSLPGLPLFRPWAVAAVAATLWAIVALGPTALRQFDDDWPNLKSVPPGFDQERQIVASLWNHASETQWLFTDRPMFGVLVDLPVPPFVAVMSRKRLQTNELTPADILAVLEEYEPEMILKGGRFDIPVVDEYIRRHDYRRVDDTSHYRLFLREDAE